MSAVRRIFSSGVLVLVGGVAVLLIGCMGVSRASERKPFGVPGFSMTTVERQGVTPVPDGYDLENVPYTFTQAGGHPWALSTRVVFASEAPNVPHTVVPTQDPKDVVVDLPPGLLGNPNPTAFPQCPLSVVLAGKERCPSDTQIGEFRIHYFGHTESLAPLVNVTPEKGQSAEFGLETVGHVTVLLTAHVVRSGSTYALTVVSNEIPMVEITEVETTFWGVPSDPSHDAMRGMICEGGGQFAAQFEYCGGGGRPGGGGLTPFLWWPVDCAGGALDTSVSSDSWETPGGYVSGPVAVMPGVTGCGLLSFAPGLEVSPDTLLADEPVALGVNMVVPQTASASSPITPELKDTVLTLPQGLSISPGIVDGIKACNESGPEGINFDGPESEEIGLNGEPRLAPGHCPDASIVGTARAFSPLVNEPVEGHVYLARPGCGGAGQAPCAEGDAADGNLYQLYLELGGTGALADAGVNLKVRLRTEANPATGQLTALALNTPPLPFSKLEVHLNGGPRAPLDNPAACGRALSSADLRPWSAPGLDPEGTLAQGTPDATPSSEYDVQGCIYPMPFRPGFTAGTVTQQAGQYSSFTLNLSRQDREQFVKGIQVHTPPGLLGVPASVPLCESAQAEAGSCPQQSRIGSTRVASGAGSHPFEIEGQVYLTGPHDGAPFGLSIVTNAVAGPFNLGLVVVRARIDVDSQSSALTITTDENGPHAIPQILDGVPLRLQRITVNIDRPNFMFNPTNCEAQHITATVSGDQNTLATVSSPFAVGACQSLAFKPSFTVTTSSHTSKANGATLDAKVSYPAASLGGEANIASVKVELPYQLPSRLTTLQKACTAFVFETNPAGCPTASIVGIARTNTPLLPVALEGPIYFVSHGGEAFPSLIVVLQGDGVRVDLTGSTFISKTGITSTTFRTIPDVPVNTFELYLPEGPYSALTALGDLCNLTTTTTTKHKITVRTRNGHITHKTVLTRTTKPASLVMPNEFTAQNGLTLKQDTHVQVTGCPAAAEKPKKKAKQASTRAKRGRGR